MSPKIGKRLPFPVGIPIAGVVGAIIGVVVAVMLVNVRRSRSSTDLVAHSVSVSDFVRLGFAAWALIQIANQFLGKPKAEDA